MALSEVKPSYILNFKTTLPCRKSSSFVHYHSLEVLTKKVTSSFTNFQHYRHNFCFSLYFSLFKNRRIESVLTLIFVKIFFLFIWNSNFERYFSIFPAMKIRSKSFQIFFFLDLGSLKKIKLLKFSFKVNFLISSNMIWNKTIHNFLAT